MDHTKMRQAKRYRIQKARRLKQHLHELYMVGHYQAIDNVVKQLSQIQFLRSQAL